MNNYELISAKVSMLKKEIDNNTNSISNLQQEITLLNSSKQFLISYSEFSKEKVKEKLENLANTALRAVFTDKSIVFRIISDRQKRGLYYDLMVETDGEIMPLFDGKGGGVMDIISIAMRISFLKLFQHKLRQSIILDEPFKNLDSDRVTLAIEWLKTVSRELEIQFIIVTHIPSLIDSADKAFKMNIINGKSEVVTNG
jgi:DNA repair exonuclease SbcCD ATPase subunit